MEELNDLLKHISETIARIEALKAESPEVREALGLQKEQERLVKKLQEGCNEQMPQVIPYPLPYVAYPDWTWRPQRYDWWNSPYRVTCETGSSTTASVKAGVRL